ncbi:PIR Superfamily Protein [Plasmodium ovale wallikeri]|uniref:PIR Superfamily Protein n=1 Tax=Plasmodium ovale wallikeri TaxID=864142 RepID=A0A1A9APV1_PLAOA|nr:PIR Superfamily Protein [Plasmodium ovale wallikeri]
MSQRINTAYNVASEYSKYKEKLDQNKEQERVSYFSECNNFVSQPITDAGQEATKICHAVALFLNFLTQENVSYKDEGCKYMFYWLHVDILKNKIPISNTLNLYRELYKIYTDEDEKYDLNDYINQVDEHTSDKLVKLTGIYDLFKKYDCEVSKLSLNTKCTSECVNLFPNYVEECRTGYDKEFCKELKNFREQYNYFISKIRKCEGEQYLLPPVENFDLVGMIIIPFSLIFVTSFILPFLYKFTALGPWIRRVIGKNKNTWNNINEDTDDLLYTDEMGNNNLKKSNYNIAYNLS